MTSRYVLSLCFRVLLYFATDSSILCTFCSLISGGSPEVRSSVTVSLCSTPPADGAGVLSRLRTTLVLPSVSFPCSNISLASFCPSDSALSLQLSI